MRRRRVVARDRMHYGPKLPRGAGAVRCEVCGAVARSTGDGRPIVLPCACHREEDPQWTQETDS